MEHIRIEEIQALLPSLLQRLHNGEEFALTNQGEVVAELHVPQKAAAVRHREAIDQFLALTRSGPGIDATLEEALVWRDEGRKS